MGRFPLKVNIDIHILNYWISINSRNENNLAKQDLMSNNRYNTGQNCYKLNIQKILETYNLSDTILKQTKLSENQIKKIKEYYLKVWREKSNCSKKLEFYKICKTEFGPAKYLTDILDPTHKKKFLI